MSQSCSCTVGIDIGGTKPLVGLVQPSGAVVARRELPTAPQDGFERFLDRLCPVVQELRASAAGIGAVAGIGVGCPGPLDLARGAVRDDFTLPGWAGRSIVGELGDRMGLRVVLENDADAALLGEARAGAGRGKSSIVMLTLGTGVGGAALREGRIYRGMDGEHPEIGHVPLDPAGPPCYCGARGCLESLASGPGILAVGKAHGYESTRQVFADAIAGVEAARTIVGNSVRACRLALRTILYTFMPEQIILGGGIIQEHYALYGPALMDELATMTMVPRERITICKAALGNDAGMVGAAMLPLTKEG